MSDTEASSMEKPIPTTEVANCAPPNEDYEYFEGCKENPFRFDSGGFEMVNAWWLSEASLLAYADPEFAIQRYREAGFDEVIGFSDDSTQCYAMHNEDFVMVAFSGSDMRHREDTDSMSDILSDWMVNFDATTVESDEGGRVHRGFVNALDEVWNPEDKDEEERLKPYLDSVCDDGRKKVWFTGHSLGAALATIAAGRYDCATELYTFGSPRVGDEDYVASLDCDIYRFVNGNDVVCKVPLTVNSYRHAGEEILLGSVDEEPDGGEGADAPAGKLQRFKEAIGSVASSAKEKMVGGIPTDHLTDHAPIFYAVFTWNDYVKGSERRD